MSVEFSPVAEHDLEEIADHIGENNPRRALSFLAEIETLCQTLDEWPEKFEATPELAPGLRRAVHGRYLIFYTVGRQQVRIERILHSARDIKDDDFSA